MLAKRIIPCLDVDNGRVVKGIRFVSLVDAGDPVEQGKRYDAEGADELTFLDITASSDKRDIVAALVRRVADEVFIPFTVGGGLRTVEDIRAILRAGADKITLNTAALEQPELIGECAETFGSQCVVVAIDARRRVADDPHSGWDVYTHGGRRNAGVDALEWALRVQRLGAGEILLTRLDRDGTRRGPSSASRGPSWRSANSEASSWACTRIWTWLCSTKANQRTGAPSSSTRRS